MAAIGETKSRRVIPNWRSFESTVALRELHSVTAHGTARVLADQDRQIREYVLSWKDNRSIAYAADLLCAAMTLRVMDSPDVLAAAEYLILNANDTPVLLREMARLYVDRRTSSILQVNESTIMERPIITGRQDESILRHYAAIHALRGRLKRYPYSAIQWVELSRLYSVIGQSEQAKRTMKIGLNLAPNNRYVVRCAARLFAHHGLYDLARAILVGAETIMSDPWIMASEIAISDLSGFSSRYIKSAKKAIQNSRFSKHSISELAASIATIEMANGSHKKSRDLFRVALQDPNDNTLAQIKWASKNDGLIICNVNDYDIGGRDEAAAYQAYQLGDHVSAVSHALRWQWDLPYSRRPALFASNVASTITLDYDTAIYATRSALVSHPADPQIVNNLAYALALRGSLAEAVSVIETVAETDSYSVKACLKATNGLIHYRRGERLIGQEYYRQAIEFAQMHGDQELTWCAMLNMVREELRAEQQESNDYDARQLANHVLAKLEGRHLDPVIEALRSQVVAYLRSEQPLISEYRHKE